MSDWNQESGAPAPKAGMPTWAKFLLGCGVLMVVMLTTCIGGAAWLGFGLAFVVAMAGATSGS